MTRWLVPYVSLHTEVKAYIEQPRCCRLLQDQGEEKLTFVSKGDLLQGTSFGVCSWN